MPGKYLPKKIRENEVPVIIKEQYRKIMKRSRLRNNSLKI